MRIAHLLACGGWGGAERLGCALADRARNAGHVVQLDAAPLAREGLRDAGFEPLGAEANLGAWALAARARVQRFAPDLVHVHLSTPAFAGSALPGVERRASVFTMHLLPERNWPSDFLVRVPSAWMLSLAARRAARARLVAVSEHDAAQLRSRFRAAGVRCVANAPMPEPPVPSADPGELFGDAPLRLLCVARLEHQKGLDRLLEALAAATGRVGLAAVGTALPAFRLVIIGTGPEHAALAESCRRSGLDACVRFAGSSAASAALPLADLVLCPSRYEGMPLVPMEGVLAGSAVVASSIAPHRELFGTIPDALLPESESEWPAFLGALLADPERRERLRRAQAALSGRFSFERLWAEYQAVYQELAAE